MKTYINPYSQKIYFILSPLIGDVMSQAVIRTQSQKIGATDESLSQKQIPILAEEIRKGLVLFIGSESAKQVSQKIAEIN
jgi:hypothetical protein